MKEWGLILSLLVPVVLILLWPARRRWSAIRTLLIWAPLPALIAAITLGNVIVDLPGLLLGSRWGLDATGRLFLAFSSLLWLAAGFYSRGYLAHDAARDRFELFHLLTMTGNLGVIIAQDMLSFLLFYTLMGLAAFGLITHDRKPESLRAGRYYLVLVVAGEILLFWAVLIAARETNSLYFSDLTRGLAASPARNLVVGLVLAGFAVKLGLMPAHFWLPLAHPAAPTPASAILSGAMIKTGLLGLIRFLPLGEAAFYPWGATCITLGLASAFLATLIGVTQQHPKTVLAYSSIGQMGLMTVGIGSGLMFPAAWPTLLTALMIYALHHGLAKSSVFLGIGVVQSDLSQGTRRVWVLGGLVMAALSLAGLPLTSGFVAKNALKHASTATQGPWASALGWLLPLTGLSTTLLMARFLWLVWPKRNGSKHPWSPAMVIPWATLTLGVFALFVGLRFRQDIDPAWVSLLPKKLGLALWPILAGAGLGGLAWVATHKRSVVLRWRPPAGDIVVLVGHLFNAWRRTWHTLDVTPVIISAERRYRRLHATMSATMATLSNQLARAIDSNVAHGCLIGLLVALMLVLVLF